MREDTSKQKAKASVKPEPVVELGLPLEEFEIGVRNRGQSPLQLIITSNALGR
jgi:hypothetical protein